jgi:hypothetical protein
MSGSYHEPKIFSYPDHTYIFPAQTIIDDPDKFLADSGSLGTGSPWWGEAIFTFDSVVLYFKKLGMPAKTNLVSKLHRRVTDENREQGLGARIAYPHSS